MGRAASALAAVLASTLSVECNALPRWSWDTLGHMTYIHCANTTGEWNDNALHTYVSVCMPCTTCAPFLRHRRLLGNAKFRMHGTLIGRRVPPCCCTTSKTRFSATSREVAMHSHATHPLVVHAQRPMNCHAVQRVLCRGLVSTSPPVDGIAKNSLAFYCPLNSTTRTPSSQCPQASAA